MRNTVIVTGATKGLGRSISLAFGKGGDCVIGLYSRDESAADSLRRELAAVGARDFHVLMHDIRQPASTIWPRPEIQGAERLILINNAFASFQPKPFHLLQWEDFESSWILGVKGSWLCSTALIKPMIRQRRGVIVNILSTTLHGLPPKGFAAYAVAKHALRGLTLALASEYAAKGIRVFSVSPRFMKTALTSEWDPRLVESALLAGETRPDAAAAQIHQLATSSSTPGQGEDYVA